MNDFELYDKLYDQLFATTYEKEEDMTCKHPSHTETDGGSIVCDCCGEVIGYKMVPEHDWHTHSAARDYNDPIKNCDTHLYNWLEKHEIRLTHGMLEQLQQRLHVVKKSNDHKSINYAIMIHLTFPEDDELQKKLKPHLPKSKTSWERNREMFQNSL